MALFSGGHLFKFLFTGTFEIKRGEYYSYCIRFKCKNQYMTITQHIIEKSTLTFIVNLYVKGFTQFNVHCVLSFNLWHHLNHYHKLFILNYQTQLLSSFLEIRTELEHYCFSFNSLNFLFKMLYIGLYVQFPKSQLINSERISIYLIDFIVCINMLRYKND